MEIGLSDRTYRGNTETVSFVIPRFLFVEPSNSLQYKGVLFRVLGGSEISLYSLK